MKQTALCREKHGEYIPCLKYSVPTFLSTKASKLLGPQWHRKWRKDENMNWNPPGRRKQGRPKLSWSEGIRGLMLEKGLVEEAWNDRDEWRKNIL